MIIKKTICCFSILSIFLQAYLFAGGNDFVFTFLKTGKMSVYYPAAYDSISDFILRSTNIRMNPAARVIDPSSEQIFMTPFLYLGDDAGITLSHKGKENLKKFLQGGGLLIIDDFSGKMDSGFDRSVRSLFKEMLPYNDFVKLDGTEPIYRSFYLIRRITGLYEVLNYFEGIYINGRLCVIYSRNNLLGVWEKTAQLGFRYTPSPGGEAQRFEAVKIMVNIIMYSVTGTYKLDRVHEPFIKQKLSE